MSILLFYYSGKFASHCSEEVLLRCVYYLKGDRAASVTLYTGCFFLTGTPPKNSKYKKVKLG